VSRQNLKLEPYRRAICTCGHNGIAHLDGENEYRKRKNLSPCEACNCTGFSKRAAKEDPRGS